MNRWRELWSVARRRGSAFGVAGVLVALALSGAGGAGDKLRGKVDPLTTFFCSYDTSAAADFSRGSPHPEGVTALAVGRRGKALLARKGFLPFEEVISPFFFGVEYETEGNLHLAEGTLEMWVQPLFDPRVSPEEAPKLRYLFSSGKYVGDLFGCALVFQRGAGPDKPYTLVWLRQNGSQKVWSAAVPADWETGSWHHLAVTYSAKQDVLFVDGKPAARFSAGEPMALLEDTFAIGSNIYNAHTADCLIDDVRLSHKVRYTGEFSPE